GGNGEPDGVGGPEVHDQLELGRLLDGKSARLRSFEHAIDICRQAAPGVENAGEIGHHPAVGDVIEVSIDGGKPVARGKVDNLSAIGDEVGIRFHDKTTRVHRGYIG